MRTIGAGHRTQTTRRRSRGPTVMTVGHFDARENAMFHTLATQFRRYDYARAVIKIAFVLSLLVVALITLNGLVW